MAQKPPNAQDMVYIRRLEVDILKKFTEIKEHVPNVRSEHNVLKLIEEVHRLQKAILRFKDKILEPMKAASPIIVEIIKNLKEVEKELAEIDEELHSMIMPETEEPP